MLYDSADGKPIQSSKNDDDQASIQCDMYIHMQRISLWLNFICEKHILLRLGSYTLQ